ncbi:glycoside hydrolase family 16 protein [Flavobacterium sp. BFFFF1]|uniref:glycoside hydrolase family 16 protein n=1 Tax=Flavobacterium sp. BFFFF1 TaxID=2015557 RepID=UPI0025BE6756|nr:glycoside hydrolase family 16 protein [Flavobacterium sp. BFFFF1]
MKRLLFVLIISIFFHNNTQAQCRLDKTNYQLVFEDNFNYSTMAALKNVWDLVPPQPTAGYGDYKDPATNQYISWGEYYNESQVSLQPGGIVRLTAQKLSTPYTCVWAGRTRNCSYVSGLLVTKTNVSYDDQMPNQGCPWTKPYYTGYLYGMFEIRCKLPSQISFPAFWLHGGYSEIDIFEYNGGGSSDEFFSTQHYAGSYSPDCPQYPSVPSCGHTYKIESPRKISDDYHTWTCVWTPTKVTTFFDGREMKTTDARLIPAFNQTNFLMANLGMWSWGGDRCVMDIDYIKVYKPIGGNYSLPYKSSNDFMNNSIFNNSSSLKVSPVQGSIASDPGGNKIYHVNSVDNRMYVSEKINGSWQSNIIQYNYNPNLPAMLCNGDLTYNPQFNKILYKGKDNRIQFFEPYSNNVYRHYFIDDYWDTSAYNISGNPGSMSVTSDGKIAYRGTDDKIHVFKWNPAISRWDQLTINYTYGLCAGMSDADFVAGDVIVEQGSNNIIYRGRDGRMQLFWQSSPFVYQHGWVDNNFGTSAYLVSNKPGSIISTPKGIFYRGADDKLHRFYWNGTTMVHQISNYTYGLCAGMPDADFVKGNLSYHPSLNFVLYVGRDGRIQRFEIPSTNTSTSWGHYWIDDYWNTSLFSSFGSSLANSFASLHTTSDGKMVYNNSALQNGLAYFNLEPCENLNPPCGITKPIR